MKQKITISLSSSILEKIPNHDQEDWIMDAIIEKLARMSEPGILEKKAIRCTTIIKAQ